MKIKDLFNKIANGRAPKLIKYDNLIWEYVKHFGDYTDTEKYLFCDYMADKENIILFLNDEIEIIEEDKKIEKIKGICYSDGLNDNEKFLAENINQLKNKINELIDELNKLKGDKNEK